MTACSWEMTHKIVTMKVHMHAQQAGLQMPSWAKASPTNTALACSVQCTHELVAHARAGVVSLVEISVLVACIAVDEH